MTRGTDPSRLTPVLSRSRRLAARLRAPGAGGVHVLAHGHLLEAQRGEGPGAARCVEPQGFLVVRPKAQPVLAKELFVQCAEPDAIPPEDDQARLQRLPGDLYTMEMHRLDTPYWRRQRANHVRFKAGIRASDFGTFSPRS